MPTPESACIHLPEGIEGLRDLASNLWWSWYPRARMLFKMLNRQAWKESGHNPDKMLRELSPEILAAAAQNPDYLRHYHVVMSLFQAYMNQIRNPRCNGEVELEFTVGMASNDSVF
ncbi:MAG: DUF3417 domain-containing protein [Deltaproteobacteria bacterium]|jgi:glycogen phosphorylase|nr:DUF3417 domain-containing protein [Deltaproteobacteria bacterium]